MNSAMSANDLQINVWIILFLKFEFKLENYFLTYIYVFQILNKGYVFFQTLSKEEINSAVVETKQVAIYK